MINGIWRVSTLQVTFWGHRSPWHGFPGSWIPVGIDIHNYCWCAHFGPLTRACCFWPWSDSNFPFFSNFPHLFAPFKCLILDLLLFLLFPYLCIQSLLLIPLCLQCITDTLARFTVRLELRDWEKIQAQITMAPLPQFSHVQYENVVPGETKQVAQGHRSSR